MIVVDTNVLAARVLSSKFSKVAEKLEQAEPVWVVPILWRYEFQNILATAIKVRQISPATALHVWAQITQVLMGNEAEPSIDSVIALVSKHRITAYDAQFVALALELDVSCVTQDAELWGKFPGRALSMTDFLACGSGSGMI